MVLVISVAVSILWIRVIKKFETPARLTGKPSVIAVMFVYGVVSIIAALCVYDLLEWLLYPAAFISLLFYNILYVGLSEEFGKFLVFYTVAAFTDTIKEPKDGLLQASSIALAFAVVENIEYSVYGMDVLLIRSLLTTTGHMSYASIWGCCSGLYLFSKRAGRQTYDFGTVLGSVCTSAVLHGLYNYFIDKGLWPVSILLAVLELGIVVFIIRFLLNKSPYESGNVRDVTDAMASNKNCFHLNRKAGLLAAGEGRYMEAAEYLRKAAELDRKEVSTRIFLVFLELVEGSLDEFGAYRKIDVICANVSTANLLKIRKLTERVFGREEFCPKLTELIGDVAENAETRDLLEKRKAELDKFFSVNGTPSRLA